MALQDDVQMILRVTNLASPGLIDITRTMKLLRDEVGLTAIAFRDFNAQVGVTMGNVTRTVVSSQTEIRAAILKTTTALGDQALVMKGMGSIPGLGVPLAAPVVESDAARVARLTNLNRATTILSSGIGSAGGLFGRVGAAALGPEGIALAAAGYVGFRASSDASQFWSALQQTGAQSGTTNPGGILNDPRAFRSFGQGILNYGASGHDPYSVTSLATGIEPLLAHGYSKDAVQGAIQSIAQFSAQNKAPDISATVSLVNTLAALQGGNPANQTAAQLKGYVDFGSRAEQLTTLKPGELNLALPRLLSSLSGTGVSAADATGLLIKTGTVNPSASRDASAMIRVISDIASPTAKAMKEAGSIGMGIGPGAIQAYGGIYGYLGALQGALGTGPGAAQGAHAIFGQTNALQGYNALLAGGGLAQTAGYTAQLGMAGGNAQAAFDQLSRGTQQQGAQLMVRFNADMTTLGTTINERVLPKLIQLGDKALTAAERLFHLSNPNNAPGQRDTGPLPAFGNFMDRLMEPLTHNTVSGASNNHTWADAVGSALPSWSSTQDTGVTVTSRADALAILKRLYQSQGQTMPASASEQLNASFAAQTVLRNGGVNTRGMTPHGALFAGQYDMDAATLPLTAAARAYGMAGQSMGAHAGVEAQYAFYANQQRQVVTKRTDQGVRDVRALLNVVLQSGGTAAQANAGLLALHNALPNSAYSAAQQAGIYASESRKVGIYDRALNAPNDQLMLTAAQQNLDAAKLMNATPAQYKVIFNEYLAAQRQLVLDTTAPGSLARAKGLSGIAQQGAVQTYQDQQTALQHAMSEAQAGLTYAQLTGKGVAGAQHTVAGLLKQVDANDPQQLQLALYQLYQKSPAARAAILPGPQLIRPNVAGLGSPSAAFTTSIAHLSSTGAQDSASHTIALLQAQVNQQAQTIQGQAQEIRELRTHTSILRTVASNTAPKPPPRGSGHNLSNYRVPV